jgi:hypothetical protein
MLLTVASFGIAAAGFIYQGKSYLIVEGLQDLLDVNAYYNHKGDVLYLTP